MLSINQAAGDGNQQANLRNLVISTDTAHANTAAQQRLSASGSPHAGSDSAIIAPDSLRNNVGLIGINQSAGQANQSANSLSLAIGGHSAYIRQAPSPRRIVCCSPPLPATPSEMRHPQTAAKSSKPSSVTAPFKAVAASSSLIR
ncbi:hypothetical protein GKE73_13325 [Paludibacterium sp. dN 18-1]|uniref:Uncharacterized protein n=1 Tax=Paludibacterium denitrificans TaxID=2675226 RepID=A0A844GGM2_9NEIS|nr:hypothetical protein [Paludibacterium denitrificans]